MMQVWIIFSNRIAANRDGGEVLGVFDSQSLAEQFAIDWKRLNVLVGDWDVWVEPIILNQERFTTIDEWSDAQ